jgi:hypothetical protein
VRIALHPVKTKNSGKRVSLIGGARTSRWQNGKESRRHGQRDERGAPNSRGAGWQAQAPLLVLKTLPMVSLSQHQSALSTQSPPPPRLRRPHPSQESLLPAGGGTAPLFLPPATQAFFSSLSITCAHLIIFMRV